MKIGVTMIKIFLPFPFRLDGDDDDAEPPDASVGGPADDAS